jgi:hypothetical protein
LNIAGQYGSVPGPSDPKYVVWLPRGSIALSNDKIADTKSVLLQSDITGLRKDYGLNADETLGPILFMWSPIIGAEHQRALRTPKNADHGSVVRFYAALDLTFKPVAAFRSFSTTLPGKAWRETNRSGTYDQGDHSRHFESISLDRELVAKQRALLGLSREVGENPTEGLPRSAVTKLAFKFKFN